MVFINDGNGKYTPQPLPKLAQVAPVNQLIFEDFTGDGIMDLLIAGNMYQTEVETPRYDAGVGLLLEADGKGNFNPVQPWRSGFNASFDVKDMALVQTSRAGEPFIVVANNDGPVQVFRYSSTAKLLSAC